MATRRDAGGTLETRRLNVGQGLIRFGANVPGGGTGASGEVRRLLAAENKGSALAWKARRAAGSDALAHV